MINGWVKAWRVSQGLTLAKLADRLGVSVAELEMIELGEPLDRDTAARIRDIINTDRKQQARTTIDRVCRIFSQRRIEHVLGLSQGYLSRLRNGGGNPSPVILATLTLLANDPNRIAELAGATAQPHTRPRRMRATATPAPNYRSR